MKFHLVVLAALGACAPLDPSDPPEELGTTESAITGECPDIHCGTNSPIIEGLGFHELNIDHLQNLQGLSIVTVDPPSGYTGHFEIRVVDGEIKLDQGALTLGGHDVQGATIELSSASTGHRIMLQIAEVKDVSSWATLPTGSGTPIRPAMIAYVFSYVGPDGHDAKLCVPDASYTQADALWLDRYDAVLFEGERIYPSSRLIDPVLNSHWFNIGCAGSALSKMALNGHTQAAQSFGFRTTILERQAILKMFSADYCGRGTPFTVPGQPLEWKDDHNTLAYLHTPTSVLQLESRWNQDGAVCMNTPRLKAHPPTGSGSVDFGAAILAECIARHHSLPSCSDSNVDHVAPNHLTSASPP
jgi:hypothetical protein